MRMLKCSECCICYCIHSGTSISLNFKIKKLFACDNVHCSELANVILFHGTMLKSYC